MKHWEKIQNQPILKQVLFASVFLFLILNLVFSQTISPLYFQLVTENKKATLSFLEKIKQLPFFERELKNAEKVYGQGVYDEVFKSERERKLKIKNLEQALEKNSLSRDVLYSLYLLYKDHGDESKAQEYFNRAKTIDPNIVE